MFDELDNLLETLRGKPPSVYILLGGLNIIFDILFGFLMGILTGFWVGIICTVVTGGITFAFWAQLAEERKRQT